MGVIATGGGFFAYFSTMWYYGFKIHGMFNYKVGNNTAAWRCQYYYNTSQSSWSCHAYDNYSAIILGYDDPEYGPNVIRNYTYFDYPYFLAALRSPLISPLN